MTAVSDARTGARVEPPQHTLGQQVVKILSTTDHKLIGKLYLGTAFAWFLIAGLMALVMRSELAFPGQQVVSEETYNQLFTMHGTIMLLMFATPLFFGFGAEAGAQAGVMKYDGEMWLLWPRSAPPPH